MRKRPGKSAWVVTWQGTAPPANRIVALLNYRLGASRIREIVEVLYATLCYTDLDKLNAATGQNPYPPEVNRFGLTISCGHNPWLYARKVTRLRMEEGKLVWKEPPTEEEIRKLSIEPNASD